MNLNDTIVRFAFIKNSLLLLQSKKIVLDTVLITGPTGYIEQKALSHATGNSTV